MLILNVKKHTQAVREKLLKKNKRIVYTTFPQRLHIQQII